MNKKRKIVNIFLTLKIGKAYIQRKLSIFFCMDGTEKIHLFVITLQASGCKTVILGTDFLFHPHTYDIYSDINRVGSLWVSVRIHCMEKWPTSFQNNVLIKCK